MSRQPSDLHALRQPVSRVVHSFDATTICYDIYEKRSRSAVLVIPGFWRDRRHPAMQRLASFLWTEGYRVAVCDLRGHGDSGGVFGFNLYEHYDVSAVVDDLVRSTGSEAVAIVGLSYGGAIAISAAARHSMPISSLLLISPVADLSMVSPRINPFTIHRHVALGQALKRPRFTWRFSRSPKLRALDDVADIGVPISLIHVRNDWLIDHTHSVALFERAREPKELHIIDVPGSYHADRIFNVASEQVEPIVTEFLARYTAR